MLPASPHQGVKLEIVVLKQTNCIINFSYLIAYIATIGCDTNVGERYYCWCVCLANQAAVCNLIMCTLFYKEPIVFEIHRGYELGILIYKASYC